MADYRCYPITLSGSIGGPAQVVDVDDDVSAIIRAHEILPEQPFEVWLGARRIFARSRKLQPINGPLSSV
jgi:hypothetical protein